MNFFSSNQITEILKKLKLLNFKPEEINFDLHSLETLFMLCFNSRVTSAIMEELPLFLVFPLEFYLMSRASIYSKILLCEYDLQTLTAPIKPDGLRIF